MGHVSTYDQVISPRRPHELAGIFYPPSRGESYDPQVTPAVTAAPKKERVAVFFDYENVHRTGHY